MAKYIWQHSKWPQFTWNDSDILSLLSLARKKQGLILARASEIGLEIQTQILTEEAQKTSAIEGEKIEALSLRSSIAKRLGLTRGGLSSSERQVEGLVEMLIDATQNYNQPLNEKRLKGWQAGLFPNGHSGIHEIVVGNWRNSTEPMQVISGQMGHNKIHFEAPPSESLKKEMKQFLEWFNKKSNLDGLIRAAIAHFWFVTIHPFDDGNGRVARAISDLALAQDESTSIRCYSFSSQISHDRNNYYKILESSQKGNLDITDWILWFLKTFIKATEQAEVFIKRAQFIGNFWKQHSNVELSQRQKKVIQKMLEAEPEGFVGGITNRKYVSITRVSPASAKRDLGDLEDKGLIKRNKSKGRSLSYSLKLK